MSQEQKNVKKPLVYFILTLVLLVGSVGWLCYQFGKQSVINSKHDVQFVEQSDEINKNAKAIADLTKQLKDISSNMPKDGKDGADGKDGRDGTNAVSHDTVIEKQTIEQVPIKGDSAYQSWLNIGNSGSEQDFINALKGESARGIEGCTSNGVLGWRYIGDIACKINVVSAAKAK